MKPKVHFLTHLAEDITRFGTALNFETEKGEQFNKHVREHILHTNKANVSKQVAVKFGKQSVMKHIVDGGSWIDDDGRRIEPGKKLMEFINSQDEAFRYNLFGGTRELADNNGNEYQSASLKNGVFAAFSSQDGQNSKYIGEYRDGFVTCWQVQPVTHTDKQQNVLRASCLQQVMNISELTFDCILDMHIQYNNGIRLINLSKFGAYWYFKYNCNISDI